ncbi:hypothetical protein E3N88_35170 [Mikania micrantha]|uniref:CCHC-type domain-containing protein n=1 Tax=Mikania micrantha TaxID=192012 RepID=A0A5N6M072_9ASTR|nr:hypothetical protein E3N88_35170 [Mikania micrantha]
MADEHNTGEGSHNIDLTQMRDMVKEEVAKALQANISMYMEGMEASLQNFIRQEFATLKTSGEMERASKKVTYKDFVACKPPEFKGEVDPLLSQRWISDIEGTFETCHCDSSDEVIFAGNQLRERGKDWWELLRKEKGRDGMKDLTWAEFKELFLKRFCPQAAIDRITEEFLNMRHKDESIDTITAIFFDKARFCPDLLQTEKMWINRYHNMLSAKFREFLSPSKCSTLSELIDCARERELELKRQEDRGEKRKVEKDVGSSKKIKFSNSPKKSGSSRDIKPCITCGKNHLGECHFKTMFCYKCGKQGHLAPQCTNSSNLCYNCYKPGHKRSDCPDLKRQSHGSSESKPFKGSSSGKNLSMADEHNTGEGSHNIDLTQMRDMVKEEVAKALQANISTYMEGMEASLQNFIRQEFATLKTSGEMERASKKVTYKDFVACKPPEFKGEVDPLLSQRWISDIEGTFETCHCDSSDEVIFAGNQLRERGKDWWELLRKEKGRDGMKDLTWAEFKELFLKRFCPQAAIDRITEEFLNMRHKDESIDTITAIFFDKARFCPDLLQTEKMWINRYRNMLSAKFREFLSPSKCSTLSELIDCARERELELKRQEDRGEKRKVEKDVGSSKKIKFSNSPKKSGSSRDIKPCITCGKNHLGECHFKTMFCYKCGKQGHLAPQCTNSSNLCYNCYKPGHKRSDCPDLKRQSHGSSESKPFKGSSSGKNLSMADEHNTGEGSHNIDLTQMRDMVKEEVAKALQANISTYMEGMEASLQNFIRQEFATLKTSGEMERASKKVTYKDFVACKPPEFKGEVDPLLSQRWISDIEGTFETCHCDSSDEVIFAGNQLRERGKDWWELLRKEKGRDGMKDLTWAEFKELFLKRFCPQAAIDRITEEFLNMRHKDESIDTITAIFFDKARFCPDLLQTEKMWINRYRNMLSAKFREFLSPSKCSTLSELIDCARERELELKRQEDRGEKRKVEKDVGSSKKIKFSNSPKKSGSSRDIKPCITCGKNHLGECHFKTMFCYKCGKQGHLAPQCTNSSNLCYNCYKPGHKRSDCPDLKRQSHGSSESKPFKGSSSGKNLSMADEHNTGEGSHNIDLTQMRDMVKEEVAKALQANISTYMEGMEASLQNFIRQEFATLKTSGEMERASKKVTYKDFVACKPPEFKGEVDPLLSQRWISDIEGTFETCHCDSSDEVIFAGNQLRERGKDWWELLRKEKGRDGMKDLTWAEFKELFLKRFCPQAAIDRITEEFLNMRHKDESIDTITAIFFDKARFCPDLLQTEKMWINRYHNMLSAKFREFLSPSKCSTLSELIDCARERELELKRQEDRGEKRKVEKDVGSSKKIKFSNSPKKSGSSRDIKPCITCGNLMGVLKANHSKEAAVGKS